VNEIFASIGAALWLIGLFYLLTLVLG